MKPEKKQLDENKNQTRKSHAHISEIPSWCFKHLQRHLRPSCPSAQREGAHAAGLGGFISSLEVTAVVGIPWCCWGHPGVQDPVDSFWLWLMLYAVTNFSLWLHIHTSVWIHNPPREKDNSNLLHRDDCWWINNNAAYVYICKKKTNTLATHAAYTGWLADLRLAYDIEELSASFFYYCYFLKFNVV